MIKPLLENEPPGYVLSVGDTSCDVLLSIPGSGEKSSPEPELIAGGTAGNTAQALARLGLGSKLVTELGNDFYGRFVLGNLRANGVDTEFVHIAEDLPTTQVIILLDEDNSPAADWPIADPGLFDLVKPHHISESMVVNAVWVHTSGTSAMYANSRAVLLHAVEVANQLGIPVSFDLNLRMHGEVGSMAGLQAIRRVVETADVVFGSVAEWRYLHPAERAVDSARQMLQSAEQIAVIRDGPAGAAGVRDEETVHVPSFKVPIKDALGAGDTFDAGFILASIEGHSLADCLGWGNATAALKLAQIGGHRGGPTKQQLAQFLDSAPTLIG